jgi:glycine/D-amino acid oxidase-like deaminating enzyme
MDVHSGTSLWQGTEICPAFAPLLEEDLRCEVAIIGGGITGTLAAHYLLQEGVDTILVDKGDPGTASTTASTGLLLYECDTPLCDLVEKVGEAPAVRSYRLGLWAIDEVESIAAELPDDCGFSRKPSYYLASSGRDLAKLEKELECLILHGFNVLLLTADALAEVSSLRAPAAIRSLGNGQINPLGFTRGLLDRARTKGLRAYSRCHVNDIVPSDEGVVLTTDRAKITARRVVVATGYAAHQMLKQDLGSLHSTYAAASTPLASFEGWPEQCLLWETARPYFYLRSSPDGRAMIGGEDTPYSTDHQRDGLVAAKVQRLRKRFEKMFPGIPFEPEFEWAGTFAQTKDGLAYIGQSPELPHAYFALGYGGNGITFGVVAARIITDLFVRRENPDAHIFRFDR